MDISEIWVIILDKLDFIVGLLIGLVGSIYSWHQRQLELKSKLYYPLYIACYDLLLIFDEIKTTSNDNEKLILMEEQKGRELYNAALKHLDDIMNSYGTITDLKSDAKNPNKDYLTMFFRVKRIVDLNQSSINTNWPKATIWFESGKKKTFNGADKEKLRKIDEFNDLYNKLLKLKELCENNDKTLRGSKKL